MNTLELLKDNNWFKKYPQKIAGVEYETSGFIFPIMVKGSKEDVLRVVSATNKDKAENTPEAKKEAPKVTNQNKDLLKSYESKFQKIVEQIEAKEAEKKKLQKELSSTAKTDAHDSYQKRQQIFNKIRTIQREIEQAYKENTVLLNIVICLKNGGSLFSFKDEVGNTHNNIPDFRNIDTQDIVFDEDTILNEDKPSYIPVFDNKTLERKGFVFDAIKINADSYIVSINTFQQKGNNQFVILSLDQLVLTSLYYTTFAKATYKQEANNQNLLQEKHYNNLSEDKRKSFFEVNKDYVLYRSLPVKIKKKISEDDYIKLDWKGKEKVYKFYKRYGAKRVKTKLSGNTMWRSFHYMYEQFIDPSKTIQKGYANKEVFAYWKEFRELMNFKINDINIQRQDYSDVRKKGLETAYGKKNTKDALLKEYGILVKRQNGSIISPTEIAEVKESWEKVLKTFGNIVPLAKDFNLLISHTGKTLVYARKALGVFYPKYNAISVSAKYGPESFADIMAHEVAHLLDYTRGQEIGRRFGTDNYESLGGKIAVTFRRNMNKTSTSNYINSIKECFARALQQYFAIENHGEDAVSYYIEMVGVAKMDVSYYNDPTFVNKEIFTNEIKPMIKEYLSKYDAMPKAKPTAKTEAKTDIKIKHHYTHHGQLSGYDVFIDNQKYYLATDADWGKPYGIAIGDGDRIYSLGDKKVKKIWKQIENEYNAFIKKENSKTDARKRIATAKAKALQIKLKLAKAKLLLQDKKEDRPKSKTTYNAKVGDIVIINKDKVDNLNFQKYFNQKLRITEIVSNKKPKLFRTETLIMNFSLPYLLSEEDVIFHPKTKTLEPKNNDPINVPVIRYKRDGQNITKRKVSILPVKNIDNLYVSEKVEDKSSHDETYDRYMVVLKVEYNNKTVYFMDSTHTLNTIKNKSTQKLIDDRLENLIKDLKDTKTVRYVRKQEIEIAKDLGIDTTSLVKLREQYLKEDEAREKAKQAKARQIEKEYEAKEKEAKNKELLKAEKDLLKNVFVDGDDVIDLAKKYGIKIPIRTIGAIRKNNVSFKFDDDYKSFSYSFTKQRGKPGYKITNSDFLYALMDKITGKKHALNGCSCASDKGLKSPTLKKENNFQQPSTTFNNSNPKPKNSKISSANTLSQGQNTSFWPIGGETGKFLQRVEKKPFHSVVITIDGKQGAGKTTMLYQYVNDFSKAGKTLFATLEQHPQSILTKEKINKYISDPSRVDMIGDFESQTEFYNIIEPYDFIFIDSWQKLLEMIGRLNLDQDLRKKFNSKVFVVVFQQTTTGRTKGGAGIVFDGDIIIKMETGSTFAENYAYFDKNRYTTIALNEITYNIAEARTIIENEAQVNTQPETPQQQQPDFSTGSIQLVELD